MPRARSPRFAASRGAVCLLAAAAIAGCGGGGGTTAAAPSGGRAVSISDYVFEPGTLTVPVGTKLTFVNHDSTAHTATAKQPGGFDTEPIEPGKRATVSLEQPGTFAYYCVFHPFMKATVRVE